MDADVVILGAGPAGCATAMGLGQGGKRVMLLERDTFPRDKACGEALQPTGVAVLSHLGLDLHRAGFHELTGVRYRMPGSESVHAPFSADRVGLATPRRRLDELLVHSAAATPGVVLETGVEVSEIVVDATGVTLETDRGAVSGATLIGADGLRSHVALSMGWRQTPTGDRYSLSGHLSAPDHGLHEVAVTFLRDGRQLWTTPIGPDELAATLLWSGDLDPPDGSVRQTFLDAVTLAEMPVEIELTGRLLGAGPFWIRPHRIANDRVLLVGDAAGYLDPIMGDGLTSSLSAGAVLAGILVEEGSAAARRYRAWERRQWWRREIATWMLLRMARSPRRAPRMMSGLRRRPEALESLVQAGEGSLGILEVGVANWAALAGA